MMSISILKHSPSICISFVCADMRIVLEPEWWQWPPASLTTAAGRHKPGRGATAFGSELPAKILHGGAPPGGNELRRKRDSIRGHPQRTQAAPLLHRRPHGRGGSRQPWHLELCFSPRGGLPYTDVYLTHVTFRYFINVRRQVFGFDDGGTRYRCVFSPKQGCAQNDNCHICFSADRCTSSVCELETYDLTCRTPLLYLFRHACEASNFCLW